jgi:uncharacterized membrane protein (DUF4010 family)
VFVETHELLFSLAVAAAAGLLIGLERERSGGAVKGRSDFAGGVRTHPLVALAGALAMILARAVGPAPLAIAFLALGAFVALGYARDLRAAGERGMTSEVAFLVTFLLGALSAASELAPPERRFLAVSATAVGVTLLLSAKPFLRPFAQRLSQDDVLSALKFLVLAVVVLPLLPDRNLGPLEALNPLRIGVLVALVVAVDLVGYATVRLLGPERGLGLTGLVGGLASSTAVTLSMSARAKEDPAATTGCLLAVLLACSVSFLRVLVLVTVVSPGLLGAVAGPLGAMAAAGVALCVLVYLRSSRSRLRAELEISNPVELTSALKFGVFFAAVLLATKAASRYLGTGGTYLAAFVAGLADVDAITLSMAGLARQGMAEGVAATAIFLATASNALFKTGLAIVAGGWRFGRWVGVALALTLVAGVAGAIPLWRG